MTFDQSMMPENRLLIVDDEEEFRIFFRDVAEGSGFLAVDAGNLQEFAAAYENFDPTAILLDLTMPGTDGVEVLRNLAKRNCKAPIILASGQDERVLATAERLGRLFGLTMQTALRKPVSLATLESALKQVLLDDPGVTMDALKRAIEGDELVVYFQPKVDLQSGDFPVIGSEALVRWNHPTLDLLTPAEFIPLAEETGLVADLNRAVLDQVLLQLAAWQEEGLALPVSVNLSPSQLTNLDLPDQIAGVLAAAELDPALLVLEVTEQTAMADVERATDILTRLRLKNFDIALDDFGAGYSSLIEMYRLPLSELKFDRSLIRDLDRDADAQTVIRALVALARELNLPVCAEGVETAQTAAYLRSIGCAKGQGFYFGQPQPADMFTELVREQMLAVPGAGPVAAAGGK